MLVRSLIIASIVVTLADLVPVAAAAELPAEPVIPATLTLGQAVALFRAHGLDLLIAEATAEGAAGDALAAGAIQNPSVSGGFYHSFFQGNAFESHNGWFAGLGDSNAIVDTLSGKRGLRRSVADAALTAARLGRADALRTLELQVKQIYYQAVAAGEALELAHETAESTAHTFDLNQVRYKSGAISEVDLSRTETAKLEAEQMVDAATLALRTAKVQLAFLLGQRHALNDFAIDAGQLRSTTPALQSTSVATLVERAMERRPDLRAQESQRTRAARSVALAHRQRFPDFGLGVQYTEQGSGNEPAKDQPSAISPPTLEISLTGTLPLFYQQQGEIKKAEADARTQDAQAAKLRAQVVADVENAYAGYQTAQHQVQRMEGRLLDRAQRARQLVELQYQKGAASLLEYLDAQRTYVAVKGEYIQNLTAYWNAIFQIESATATEVVP